MSPAGYKLWCTSFDSIGSLIEWFKKVGWRNSAKCRKDWKQAWDKRHAEAKARRGPDAFEDHPRKSFGGWAPETTRSGLQTPGAAAGTPTLYSMEASAPTPSGMMTPTGMMTPSGLSTPAAYGGYRTPDPRQAPGSPAPMKGFSTPRGSLPMTPVGLGKNMRNPSTPHGALNPGTPAGLLGAHVSRVPATPLGLVQGNQQRVPMTPLGAGGVPSTPTGASRIPMTPLGAGGGVAGRSNGAGRANFVPTTPR